jgi:hypothetical protein
LRFRGIVRQNSQNCRLPKDVIRFRDFTFISIAKSSKRFVHHPRCFVGGVKVTSSFLWSSASRFGFW